MDAGVISCHKACFRRGQGCYAVNEAYSVIDDEEKSEEDIYKVDILQAMHWCRDAWESGTQSTIANCWKHKGIIPHKLLSSFMALQMCASNLLNHHVF